VPREGIEPPTQGSSIISLIKSWTISSSCNFTGAGRWMQDYCWDSPASLYTFFNTL